LAAKPKIIVPRRLEGLHHDVARDGTNCGRLTVAVLFDTDDDYLARIFGLRPDPDYFEALEWFQKLPTANDCLRWGHRAGPMTVEAMKKEALTVIRDDQGRQVYRFYCHYGTAINNPDKYAHAVVLEKDPKAPLGYELRDYRERFLFGDGASLNWSTELGPHDDALPPGQLYRVLDQKVTEAVAGGQFEITSLYWLRYPTEAREWMKDSKKKVDEQCHAR
jgi:hypothetical protein